MHAVRRGRVTRLATRRTALIVGGIELAMAAAVGVLSSQAHLSQGGAGLAVTMASLLGVGLLVSYKRPEHRMGWFLLGGSGCLLLTGIGGTYSVIDYTQHHGDLPLGAVAVLIQPAWAPAITLLALAILLYPDGRAPSPRWRWPLRWLVSIAMVWQAGAFMIAADALLTGKVRLDSSGNLQQFNQPSGGWAWWGAVQMMFFLTVLVLVIAWLVGQVVGYRKLTGERRMQQKWLLSGASIAVLGLLLIIPEATLAHPGPLLIALGNDVQPVCISALPIAIGAGILKYHLYEIDRIVSRTVSYAILTLLLAGTFIGLVALTTELLPFSSSVGVAASTLAAAALVNPLRVKVQHLVDRRFNRARYDAEAAVAAFAGRLRDAVDLDAIRADLLDTVHRSVEPAHATVWIRRVSPLDEAPDGRIERVAL
jgi:hypothetical protein